MNRLGKYAMKRIFGYSTLFLITECTIVMGLGKRLFPASPRLAFMSPPILFCETSKGSEFDWIEMTKR